MLHLQLLATLAIVLDPHFRKKKQCLRKDSPLPQTVHHALPLRAKDGSAVCCPVVPTGRCHYVTPIKETENIRFFPFEYVAFIMQLLPN